MSESFFFSFFLSFFLKRGELDYDVLLALLQANKMNSVYIAGQVLKKLLATYPNGVDGQQAVAEKKAELIYAALEAHPEAYKIVPDKSARSKMNICFRVIKVCFEVHSNGFCCCEMG